MLESSAHSLRASPDSGSILLVVEPLFDMPPLLRKGNFEATRLGGPLSEMEIQSRNTRRI